MTQDNFPKFLILHHSWSPDNKKVNDWEGIRKYHMSYRYNGNIITEEEYHRLSGLKDIDHALLEVPWVDIGYHAGVDYIAGVPTLMQGRPDIQHGAHTSEGGMNFKSLGFCTVGCFDKAPPDEATLKLTAQWCAEKCKKYNLDPIVAILPHRKFATYKTCPGTAYPMEKVIAWTIATMHELELPSAKE